MMIETIGPRLFELNEQGQLKSRVGTVFPRHRVLVTVPGIHAMQRLALLERLNQQRQARGETPLGMDEEARALEHSVDLFFEAGAILIRPDPERMDLAFEADVFLQELVSKRQIKFLFALNPKVRQPLKQRGESWRISPLPRSRDEMEKLIADSKVAIQAQPIYYYSRASGTRYVTAHQFARLESLDAAELARQLQEIADHAARRNRLGNPEVDFFETDRLRFSARDLAKLSFSEWSETELRARYQELKARFLDAVEPAFREDDARVELWRNRMFSLLVSPANEPLGEEVLRGLSPEFFMQIEWLPGGRYEEGEFMFDPIFDEADEHLDDESLQRLCDRKARGFIFNFIREYGDLDYVNVGHVAHSLSKKRPVKNGRRDVYIAELKPCHAPAPVVCLIRLLKWGIRERLDEGKDLLRAILESEEYVDYLLDRRLGCRQLGMNLPPRIIIRRVPEIYHGPRPQYKGKMFRAPYSERDYLQGVASDKLPSWKYAQEGYALRMARLLGRAAVPNLIVGRTYDDGTLVIFDDGDEVVVEDEAGLPCELVVGDHSGAFGEYKRPLIEFAKDYARPVNNRVTYVAKPREFAVAYLEAFHERVLHLQSDYHKRRRAFDTLFKEGDHHPGGGFAYRWEQVLKRLDQTNVVELVAAIRREITVLSSGQ